MLVVGLGGLESWGSRIPYWVSLRKMSSENATEKMLGEKQERQPCVNLSYYCYCVCGGVYLAWYARRSEDNFVELVICFYLYMGPGIKLKLLGLQGKHLTFRIAEPSHQPKIRFKSCVLGNIIWGRLCCGGNSTSVALRRH